MPAGAGSGGEGVSAATSAFATFLTGFAQLAVSFATAVAAVVFVGGLLAFAFTYLRSLFDHRPSITIEADPKDKDYYVQMRLWAALSAQSQRFSGMLDALPPLWLSTRMNADFGRLVRPSELQRETIDLKFASAEIKGFGFDRLLSRLPRARHAFRLRVVRGESDLRFILEGPDQPLAFNKPDDTDTSLEEASFDISVEIAAVSNRRDSGRKQLVRGLLHMARYFDADSQVKHLDSAAKAFDAVSGFEARILALMCTQLSQRRPGEVARRSNQLLTDYKAGPRRFRQIMKYQRAVADFYTYEPEKLKSALNILNTFRPPHFGIRVMSWIGFKGSQRAAMLYLLARADSAVVVAHMRPSPEQDLATLRRQLGAINKEVEALMQAPGYRVLEPSLKEVRWRLLNSRAASAYNWQESSIERITAAREEAKEALRNASYALDVQANEATLYLLEAAVHTEAGQISNALEQAGALLAKLEDTEWDPGYVHFRLAQVHRARRQFEQAMRHLAIAADPAVRDMPPESLDAERRRIDDEDSRLSIDQI